MKIQFKGKLEDSLAIYFIIAFDSAPFLLKTKKGYTKTEQKKCHLIHTSSQNLGQSLSWSFLNY